MYYLVSIRLMIMINREVFDIFFIFVVIKVERRIEIKIISVYCIY